MKKLEKWEGLGTDRAYRIHLDLWSCPVCSAVFAEDQPACPVCGFCEHKGLTEQGICEFCGGGVRKQTTEKRVVAICRWLYRRYKVMGGGQ